jgi:trehalose 6-phosphate phosphatase
MAVPLTSIEPLRPLLARRPLGVVSDIDGTLSPIVSDPAAARITPLCLELLAGLVAKDVRVALITGRTLEKARSMAPVEGIAFAANHGLNLWLDGQMETPEAVREYAAKARQLLPALAGLDSMDVVIEDKGPVLAFHYRTAHDPARARDAILAAISASPLSREFQLQEGRKVIELRPPVAIDKGTALQELAGRLAMRSVICLGDDITDVHMFRSLRALRDQRRIPAASVAVRSEEASPAVLDAADYLVNGVAGVEWLLQEVLRALP